MGAPDCCSKPMHRVPYAHGKTYGTWPDWFCWSCRMSVFDSAHFKIEEVFWDVSAVMTATKTAELLGMLEKHRRDRVAELPSFGLPVWELAIGEAGAISGIIGGIDEDSDG